MSFPTFFLFQTIPAGVYIGAFHNFSLMNAIGLLVLVLLKSLCYYLGENRRIC